MIRAWRLGCCRAQFAESLVEGGQHLEGVGAARSGVVGDFVVAEERVVDHRDALEDVRGEHEKAHLLHGGVGGGPDQGIFERAMQPRLDLVEGLLPGLPAFAHDFAEEEAG